MRFYQKLLFAQTALFSVPGLALAAIEKPQPAVVFVSQVKSSELFDDLTYPARVTPKVNSTILAETDGVVSRIAAPLGQRVAAGQTVLTIKHTDPGYQYAPARVTSSVAGVVSALDVTEGTQVIKGQKLGAVTDPSLVRLTVEIPAADIALLRRGILGEFSMPGHAEKFAVRIRGISPFVDPATGTASCEIDFEKPKRSIAPGLIGQVSFKANLRHGFSIPDQAVHYSGDDSFVRLVENGKAKKVSVRLGNRQRGHVEVLEGLQENDTLVERSSRFIGHGDSVTVETSHSTPGAESK